MLRILILPGLRGSGPRHWQSWFEQRLPHAVRVPHRDWNSPDLAAWSVSVRREIHRGPGRVLLVAHSFGCLAAVHACREVDERVAGAMLVAPADPKHFGIEAVLPNKPLGFPAILVASETDGWLSFGRAQTLAHGWAAQLVNAGAVGHINVASGHGHWPEGLTMLKSLQQSASAGDNTMRCATADVIQG